MNISTNLASLVTQNSLKRSTLNLNEAIERMTTGFKINHAKDNAANYSISNKYSTKISAYEVAEDNAMMGLDLVSTASGTLDLIEERVSRLRYLQEQALNGTNDQKALDAINAECNTIVDEINRIYSSTEYNNIPFFSYEDNNAPSETVKKADSSTIFGQLGIGDSSFSIYDSSNNLVITYDTLETDSIHDFFDSLANHGLQGTINNGVISITSPDGSYIEGDLADALGISKITTPYIESTNQSSTADITYTLVSNATESTTFGELGASGTVTIRDKYDNLVGSFETDSTTTISSFFNQLDALGISGKLTNGVITLTSSAGNYAAASGAIADLGIGLVTSDGKRTTGVEQTSTLKVTTTTSSTQTDTIWQTTTTESTATNTIWTTTTTSTTQTNTIWVTTTTSTTTTNTITTPGTYVTQSTGAFLKEIAHIDTTNMTALSEVANKNVDLAAGTYAIKTVEDLEILSQMSNDYLLNNTYTFVLGSDLDMAVAGYSAETGKSWTPIINGGSYCFDGNGYAISNLYINAPESSYVGLFGCLSGGGVTIKNLGLEDVYVSGRDFVGGLIGGGDSFTAENCYVTGHVIGNNTVGGLVGQGGYTTIFGCYSEATVNGNSTVGGFGGLIDTDSKIEQCYSASNVTGTQNVGGLLGQLYMNAEMYDSYAMGNVTGGDNTGGLVGISSDNGHFEHVYASGTVSSSSASAGGLIGFSDMNTYVYDAYVLVSNASTISGIFCGYNENEVLELDHCYYNQGLEYDYVGSMGENGSLTSSNIQSYTGSVPYVFTKATNYQTTVGSKTEYIVSTVWQTMTTSTTRTETVMVSTTLSEERTDFLAVLTQKDTSGLLSVSEINGKSSFDGITCAVRTTEDLQLIAQLTNAGNEFSTTTFILANDLDFTGIDNWTSIGNEFYGFKGSFDGNGYVISKLNIDSTNDRPGLFGTLYGSVSNLGLENVNVSGGTYYTGALAGYAESCQITNCYAIGQVKGAKYYVGGLIGGGTYVGIYNSYFGGEVRGYDSVGGIAGVLTMANVSSCFFNGTILGNEQLGGITGYYETEPGFDTVVDCYVKGKINLLSGSPNNVGGLFGYLEWAELKVNHCYVLTESPRLNGLFAGGLNEYSTITIENSYYGTFYQSSTLPTYDGGLKATTQSQLYTGTHPFTPDSTSFLMYTTITEPKTQTTTVWITTTSEATRTEAVTTPISNTILETETIWETTTTATTNTETLWETTTTSTTETETIYTTTTTSSTQTSTIYTTTTSGATGTSTFNDIGLASNGYITVYSNGTSAIMTVKTSSTLADLTGFLSSHGITASISNGVLEASPQTGSYITGMSENLRTALGFDPSNYTVSEGKGNTSSNKYSSTINTSLTGDVTFASAGVSGGTIKVHKANGSYATIKITGTDTMQTLQEKLEGLGFTTDFSNNKLTVNGKGNLYIESSTLSLLNLGAVNKVEKTNVTNSSSNRLTYKEALMTLAAVVPDEAPSLVFRSV